jgi:hypothetical protein
MQSSLKILCIQHDVGSSELEVWVEVLLKFVAWLKFDV